jgi:long-subunit fatty acid transport protein
VSVAPIPGPPLPDGKVSFDNMTDLGYQPFVGLSCDLSHRLLLAGVYRAEMDVNLEGDLNFRNLALPTPPADEIENDWDNPQVLKVGLRYGLAPGRRVIFSADWEDWSAFSENQLAFTVGVLNPTGVLERNFRDTWNVGVAFVDLSKKTAAILSGFPMTVHR